MLSTTMSRWLPALCALAVLGAANSARATCPVGQEIKIDNDIPGSGYREVRPENWATWGTNACHGSYRYTSHTVGDGSREGKAIWEPAITLEGWYEVTVGYRLTENRTTHADYFVYDDAGAVDHTIIDQYVADRDAANCEYRRLGEFFCRPGGDCRVELDSTDGYDSPSADIATFKLVRCDAPTGADAGGADAATPDAGTPGRCDGIRQNPNYEVCAETSTTCTGVFTDGSGCEAFCAAAGMDCAAKFGGEPGCQKEADLQLSCGQSTGHQSDWCECAGPPPNAPDAGPADAGAADTGQGSPDTGPPDVGQPDTDGLADAAPATDIRADDVRAPQDTAPADDPDAVSSPQDAAARPLSASGQGSCHCRAADAPPSPTWILTAFLPAAAALRRRLHPG